MGRMRESDMLHVPHDTWRSTWFQRASAILRAGPELWMRGARLETMELDALGVTRDFIEWIGMHFGRSEAWGFKDGIPRTFPRLRFEKRVSPICRAIVQVHVCKLYLFSYV